jgi:uncharacterized protein
MTTPHRHRYPSLAARALITALLLALALVLPGLAAAQDDDRTPEEREHAEWIRAHYSKTEAEVPMRDGAKLWTAVYTPNDASEDNPYPILMIRTPYRVDPYGAAEYRDDLGPSRILAKKGYIFVYQDVRGRNMSDGLFVNMTPHRPVKDDPTDVDESTDTYDTVEWLVEHVPHNNGKVGQWGISYPGFYAAAGMIDSHPALSAVSPQAPIADWYFDDFHHHGAFFLPHTFNFFASFGIPREGKTTERGERFDHGTPDGYSFFLNAGTWKNLTETYLEKDVPFLTLAAEHPNYDAFWQSRNIVPHLEGVTAAVLTVGGWYDAEDLWGPLKIYRGVEEKNPRAENALVMGPWGHGGWARTTGESLGNAHFGFPTSAFYQENIEAPFFEHHLKGAPDPHLPEAYVFETGANRWRRFGDWPPAGLTERALYLQPGGGLAWEPPPATSGAESVGPWDRFVSDPAKPVPYTEVIDPGMTKEYMTADQRFAARRPDVLVYRTEPLESDVTLAGPITAELWVSTSETDADWVVKVIDVLPPDTPDPDPNPTGVRLGEYQMMVRSEVIRGRFRNGYETPEPFEPGTPTRVELELQDVLHTFRRGHRIMVQVQSTWFPLVDRNPQKFVPNIFEAEEDDYVAATHRVYRDPENPSRLVVGVLPHPLH